MAEQINVIPIMTSNTSPTGIASASSAQSETLDAWKAFDRDLTTSWTATRYSLKGWLAYEFASPIVIDKYTMAFTTPDRLPKDWTFEGTNDDVIWDILDTRIGINDWINSVKKEFAFKNNVAYKKYRLNVTANNGNPTYLQIGELEMFEKIPSDKILIRKSDGVYVYFDTSASTISQLNGLSEKNLIKYGMDSVEGFNSIFTNKNYILTETDSKDVNGLWTTQINRKPLSIKLS